MAAARIVMLIPQLRWMRHCAKATRHGLGEAMYQSAESTRGWTTDTLGSDSYPGLIDKEGSGIRHAWPLAIRILTVPGSRFNIAQYV